jgi:hypothetical protein
MIERAPEQEWIPEPLIFFSFDRFLFATVAQQDQIKKQAH